MAKKPKTLDYPASRWDIITDTIINTLFKKLEEIRQYHKSPDGNPSGFSGDDGATAFNTSVAQDQATITNNYPSKVKEYITELEKSSYISSGYASQIPVPSAGDLITLQDYIVKDVDIINQLIGLDANCTAHYSTNYGNNSPVYSGDNADQSPEWAY